VNLRGLDALRGALALFVLAGHARWLLWTGHAAWMAAPHAPWQEPLVYASAIFRYGREAVLIFFALSGFFIHLRAAESLASGRPAVLMVGRYAARRLHRLAPTYYCALAVTLICDSIGRSYFPSLYLSQTGDALLDVVFASGGYSAASVYPAAVMLSSSLGRDFGSNGPLWSLGYEVVYYAVYPAWLAVRTRSAAAAFVVVPAACVAFGALAPPSFLSGVLVWYPLWLCGALLVERFAHRGALPPAVGFALFLGGFAGYVLAPSLAMKVVGAVGFSAGALLVAALTVPRGALAFAEHLGRRSYTIYAMHFPLLALMSAATFHVFGARPTHGWLALAGGLAAVVVCLWLFHLCERHSLHERLTLPAAA
jgi:peptidoglycan/LPS O-acetylase OafA/YrhL